MVVVSDEIALYIHIPFCRRKCNYCSFVSYQCREAEISSYVNALKNELARRAGGKLVRSIYLGGGTPSLLTDRQVEDILASVGSLFTVDKTAEVTMEANPGTVDTTYLTNIRALGVNRLSLGIQSLDDKELALLGRIHTYAQAIDAVLSARNSDFTNLNLDLIYGFPSQTQSDWQKTLDKVIEIAPEHLSLYGLSLEPDTPMWRAIKEHRLPDIDPDVSADQYELAEDLLTAHGYHHYEISNWAKPGQECRHNLTYWQNRPYLGAGVAAHSYLERHRLANTKSLDKYLAAFSNNLPPPLDLDETINQELELAETVILGLRLNQGIYLDDIRNRFGIDLLTRYGQQVAEMVDAGLLEQSNGHIKLTPRGRLLSNEVFWRFLPEQRQQTDNLVIE
ncbi:MAG: radical SAM family heme chaperone HemW [Chloroflexi bacterium]|nr:radical SAM family heme chaperone HemW [Chloroflexota bacterium]